MSNVVLLTGGSGLLALNWALAMRHECVVSLGFHHREVNLAGVRHCPLDLESVDACTRRLEIEQPQIVVHTAGLTNVDECEAKPELARHVNVTLASNMALACAKLGIKLVHISTDHLFAGDTPCVDELHPPNPRNTYGLTKAEAEQKVLAENTQALVVRTNFYGWGTRYRRSFSDLIIDSLRRGKPLTLFTDVFYTPIFIGALTSAVNELLAVNAGGIFNLVGDERISKYEFGLKVAKSFGLDAALIKPGLLSDNPALVQRPFDMSLSNQKACKLLHRRLGSVDEHIGKLLAQEQYGLARELREL